MIARIVRTTRFFSLLVIVGLLVVALITVSCATPPQPTPTQLAPEPTKVVAQPTNPPQSTAIPVVAKPGKALIGKLEGPEIITDLAKYPKTLKEAPQLIDLVKAGKLPKVEDRVGKDPLVVKPVNGIGKYGGILRRGFTGPGDLWNGVRIASGPDNLLFLDYTAQKIVPNIAKSYEFGDEGRNLILHLREGMRWSDGEPFIADDIMFWFNDLYGNKDLWPTQDNTMTINGKPVMVEKVDTYTVKWKSPDPYYLLAEILAGNDTLGGQWQNGNTAHGGFAPAHYLKQFHPKYVSKEELDKKVKDGKFDSWISLIKFKNSPHLNPELPVVSPWMTTSPANTSSWVLERNPYSIWVDTDGNQLPYIDKIVMTVAESVEVVNLRAIAGEYDFQARHIDLGKLPTFLDNQTKGGYKVYMDPADYGADMDIRFNISYNKDPEIRKWFWTTDFRRALSLGTDREQLNETFWLGTGTPGSCAPVETNKYYPGAEFRSLWSTYDVKKANEMLDKIGLDKKDAEGYRLRTDGKGRLTLELQTIGQQFMPFTKMGEMIREQWKKIGIDLTIKEVERSLSYTRSVTDEQMLSSWSNDGTEAFFTTPNNMFPYLESFLASQGAAAAKWFNSGGKKGEAPPQRMQEMMAMWTKGVAASEEERVRLGKEIWKITIDEQYTICVVGQGAGIMGVRIANVKLGNIPSREVNSAPAKTYAISRPQTFYWK